jgi:hypothetical protein
VAANAANSLLQIDFATNALCHSGTNLKRASTINTSMRLHEITTIKPIKPLTPAQTRIAMKKKQVDVAKQALDNERETM